MRLGRLLLPTMILFVAAAANVQAAPSRPNPGGAIPAPTTPTDGLGVQCTLNLAKPGDQRVSVRVHHSLDHVFVCVTFMMRCWRVTLSVRPPVTSATLLPITPTGPHEVRA